MTALARLLQRLDLVQPDTDEFYDLGAPDPLPRVFGGQVAAQALAAMGRTVPAARPVHSLHVRFVGTVHPAEPLHLRVARVKEGRAFDVREVAVRQCGRIVLTASASFQKPEPGDDFHRPAPPLRNPDELPRWESRFAGRTDRLTPLWRRSRPLDVRFEEPPAALDHELTHQPRPGQRLWVRADGPLPEDPLLHACLLVYASDLTLLETAVLPHGVVWSDGRYRGASLDHTMWFYRPLRLDEWLCFDQQAEFTGGARGLASGRFLRADGDPVATVVQEGLLRPTHGRPTWLGNTAPHPEELSVEDRT
ncbi:thioesterase family protein [Micromonospora sp. 4G57]|uniref:Thioesterase family protein n=1 Tax=Micromonospora sicca TaxID=2202420 RepID=A0ABU5JLF7_9ACTN|nr:MULTISPECIES: acyl-CoA thioesterase domain-containing protein [unclassified Micromonospora]MDZ5446358.1 thioesterase family protein [Micromonospora sp. 4G57]MDZ5493453.1 thioesterase family protein [Micromonospora sp. 4G53]